MAVLIRPLVRSKTLLLLLLAAESAASDDSRASCLRGQARTSWQDMGSASAWEGSQTATLRVGRKVNRMHLHAIELGVRCAACAWQSAYCTAYRKRSYHVMVESTDHIATPTANVHQWTRATDAATGRDYWWRDGSDETRWTPPDGYLYSAAFRGVVAEVKELLSLGADVSWAHPAGGATALYVAVELGHAEVAKALLDARADASLARVDGATPLLAACSAAADPDARHTLAAMLLGAGARPDPAALRLAVSSGGLALVQSLLEHRADPTAKVDDGARTLPTEARQAGHASVADLLEAHAARWRLGVRLYTAAFRSELALLDDALSLGAPLGWRHPQGGATALYVASELGHVEAVAALLAARAEPDAARDDGSRPLHAAAALSATNDAGGCEVARLLVRAGARPSADLAGSSSEAFRGALAEGEPGATPPGWELLEAEGGAGNAR